MKVYIPVFSYNRKSNKLITKVKKKLNIQDSFLGYTMPRTCIAELRAGSKGWNLFINRYAEEDAIDKVLYYILKNKRAFLFDMENSVDYKIEIYEEKDKVRDNAL